MASSRGKGHMAGTSMRTMPLLPEREDEWKTALSDRLLRSCRAAG